MDLPTFSEVSMRIVEMSQDECKDLLSRASVGRLACSLDNHPYVVPICFVYEPEHVYVFSTLGQKIKWMRQNPNVCLQTDDITNRVNWTSVVINGTFVELRGPVEIEHARERLAKFAGWWPAPLAERREHTSDLSIDPIFFRIDIALMSGLRTISEGTS